MKTIRNLTKQEIVLEGFGVIEIKENISGEWQIDLFPRNSENNRDKIQIETTFSATGSKYFEFPKENKKMKSISLTTNNPYDTTTKQNRRSEEAV